MYGIPPEVTEGEQLSAKRQWNPLIRALHSMAEDIVPVPAPREMYWAKVQTGFSNVAATATQEVSVKHCEIDGNSVFGAAFDVLTPIKANRATSLFTDDIVGWRYDAVNDKVIVTCWDDDAMDTVKWFAGTVADIPAGWELCDGANDTIDLSAKFLMCIDVDGAADEKDIGDTGGLKTDTLGSAFDTIDALDAGDAPGVVTDSDGDTMAADAGEFGTQSDNRPPYYVLAAMQRVN